MKFVGNIHHKNKDFLQFLENRKAGKPCGSNAKGWKNTNQLMKCGFVGIYSNNEFDEISLKYQTVPPHLVEYYLDFDLDKFKADLENQEAEKQLALIAFN